MMLSVWIFLLNSKNKKKVPDETSSHDQEIQDSPCYDDIHVIQGQQELELKENTAYGLLQ